MSKGSDNRRIVDECFSALLDKLGLENGKEAIRVVVENFGGLQVYVPGFETFVVEARDRAICQAYRDGYDYGQLAAAHRLTKKQIRRIIHGKVVRK